MKLWAIADLHLRYEPNRAALAALVPKAAHPDDWLIVAGDVGETLQHLRFGFTHLTRRFARVFWVPGNHELWHLPGEETKGEAKYRQMVELARDFGVTTPEDPYPLWPGETGGPERVRIAPLHLLYDYTFRPDDVPVDRAVAWAMETEVLCSDEALLSPDPFPSRAAWCHARCRISAERLEEATAGGDHVVLVNHYPLRQEHADLPAVPRFMVWCGTRQTADWHRRFRAVAVVYGHLHIPRTTLLDGVRFEEVSFGYPRNWEGRRTLDESLRQILPPPVSAT